MRKSKWLKILLIIIVVILVGAIYLVSDQKVIGKEIDSFKNVAINYNGIIYTNSYGKNYSEDGYYYGQKWQCVEYIKRFYYQAKKHKMPDVYGNAKDFFDPGIQQGELFGFVIMILIVFGGCIKTENPTTPIVSIGK